MDGGSVAVMAVGVAGIAAAAYLFVSASRRRVVAAPGASQNIPKQLTGSGVQDLVRHGEPNTPANGSPAQQIAAGSAAVTAGASALGGLFSGLGGLFGGGGNSDGSGLTSDASGASLDAGGIGGDPTLAAASGGDDGTGNYDFGSGLDFGGDV